VLKPSTIESNQAEQNNNTVSTSILYGLFV